MAVYNETSKGGLLCGGSALVPPVIPVGETKAEMEAYSRFLREWENVDAAPLSGTEPIFKALSVYSEDATGGVLGGGDGVALAIHNVDATGGVLGGGLCDTSDVFDETGSGGVLGGGQAAFVFDETGSGGVLGGGSTIVGIGFVSSGGVLGGGTADLAVGFIASGGVLGGGAAINSVAVNQTGSGGVSVGATSDNNLAKNKYYTNNDPAKRRIVVGGAAVIRLDLSYIASGGVSVGGSFKSNFKFLTDLTCLWRINARITRDMTFLWNTGRLPLFWYRVVGKQSAKCEPLQPCCQKIVTNIFARTPAELCDKLRARRFQFRIDSVQRFERPAENSQIVNDDGCNDLIPVEICEVPACAEFCVDHEPFVFMGIETRVQVDSFFSYEPTSSTVYTGGSASVVLVRNVPDFPYEAEGGITMGGTVDYISSGYGPEVGGTITIGGTAGIKSSNWSYVGGEWPLITGDLAPTQSESLEEVITDVPWGAIDRVLNDDALPTQVELSYGKTSEYLIVRGFDIHIPNDASIRGVVVKVRRSASNIGVVDEGVYLLVGDEIISDNLANAPDWPLIQSEWWYGNTGGEQDVNPPWIGEDSELPDIEPSDVNDPEFGFAIRIKSRTMLAAIFAFVTYIDLEIYYEYIGDVHILRTGGEAKVVSSAYSYEFSPGLGLGGTAGLKVGRRYITDGLSPTLNPGVKIGGGYAINYIAGDTSTPEDVVVGGEAECRPSWQHIDGTGGASMGGEAKVTPYIEIAEGGVSGGGLGNINNTYFYSYDATGEITVGGTAAPPEAEYFYEATGSITVEENGADYMSSNYHFTSDGNAIFVLGGADFSGSDLGVQQTEAGADFRILELNFNYGEENTEEMTLPAQTVTKCACPDMSPLTEVSHNMARDNRLAQFLVRNNFTIPRILTLKYNVPNDSWQTNLHYRGVSSKSNNFEDWNLVFELRCTDNSGGIEIGKSIWQFSALVTLEDLVTGEDFDTRILVGVIPDTLCSSNQLTFRVDYDTELDFVEVSPTAVVYNNVLFDNIGLFKNRSWQQNPTLTFQVSQSGIDALTPRYDASGFGGARPMRTV